jgi:uncharacterized protein YyaL (SSP411 family)
MTGDQATAAAAERVLGALAPTAARHPLAVANLAVAAGYAPGSATEVVVAGERPDLLDVVRSRFEPTAVLVWGERAYPALWEGRADDAAYVCRRYTCRMPVHSPDALVAELDAEADADRAAAGGGP